MSSVAEMPLPSVRWNLDALYTSMEDPAIPLAWAKANADADAFATKYRGQIAVPTLTAEALAIAIKEFEDIHTLAAKPISYAHLLFSCDSSDSKVGAFLAAQGEQYSSLNVKLLFFELEVQDIPDEIFDSIASHEALANYAHYVQIARKFRPYKLTEAQEVILEETANTGSRAWVRYYEELFANHTFKVTMPDGSVEELSESEVLALLRDPNRSIRQAGADGLTAGLAELERSVVFIYNTLLLDKKTGDRLRNHPYAEHTRHMANELDKSTVDLVVGLCKDNQHLVERFYNTKREILGFEKLTHVDRYAPLAEASERKSYNEAREIIEKAIGSFSPNLRDKASEFFDKEWIDAEPRKGKQGGAYCNSITPDLHPVVFMNYQNKLDDVMTLAHELGHGVHGSLSRSQTFLNFHPTLPLAELASIFAEMLVFESLVNEASSEAKLSLYAEKIEGMFATVFRQASMYRFENRAHLARREEGELDAETFQDIWQEELQSMFGSAVELGDQHRSWWMYVGHFFYAPFYVYAYAFGELLVLSLYEMAKKEGTSFAAKYEELLSLGGSRTPAELMSIVGVDLTSREFWEGGFQVMERFIETFEGLWQESKA